jgi:hypothetical protein
MSLTSPPPATPHHVEVGQQVDGAPVQRPRLERLQHHHHHQQQQQQHSKWNTQQSQQLQVVVRGAMQAGCRSSPLPLMQVPPNLPCRPEQDQHASRQDPVSTQIRERQR